YYFFAEFLCPHSTTLLPYTTLFRSPETRTPRQGAASTVLRVPASGLLQRPVDVELAVLGEGIGDAGLVVLVRPVGDVVAVGHRPDRKSTRLNSSHVKISYAVFCLKK